MRPLSQPTPNTGGSSVHVWRPLSGDVQVTFTRRIPDRPTVAAMPSCRICGQPMLPREADAEAIDVDKFVCVNAECLEFGVYKAVSTQR
jgi:hypothetical protein